MSHAAHLAWTNQIRERARAAFADGDTTNPFAPRSDGAWYWDDEIRRQTHARDCDPDTCCPEHNEHHGAGWRVGASPSHCHACLTDEGWNALPFSLRFRLNRDGTSR